MDGDEEDNGVPKRKHGTGGANKCLNGHCRCGINASGGPALSQIWRKRKEQLKLVLGGRGAVCFCIGFGVVLHYSVFQRISVVSQRYFIVSQYNREIHVFHVSQ